MARLKALDHAAELHRFPDRTTAIGGLIGQYLTKAVELDDKAAHLLFSANRWELMFADQTLPMPVHFCRVLILVFVLLKRGHEAEAACRRDPGG